MNFLDEVKKAQSAGKLNPSNEDKYRLEIDGVVNELATNIKQQILKAAEEKCNEDNLSVVIYFCIPMLIGVSGPHLYERKTISSGSGFSYRYEYSATEYMKYMRDQLSSVLMRDNISVSECLIGTTTNQGLVAAKRIDCKNLGLSIEYYVSDTMNTTTFRNGKVNVYGVYEEFNASSPIFEERKNGTFSQLFGGTKKTITQGYREVRIHDEEHFSYLLKITFSSRQ